MVLMTPSPIPSPLTSVTLDPPGAATSTVVPKFEYAAGLFSMVVALTETTPS